MMLLIRLLVERGLRGVIPPLSSKWVLVAQSSPVPFSVGIGPKPEPWSHLVLAVPSFSYVWEEMHQKNLEKGVRILIHTHSFQNWHFCNCDCID